MDEARSATPWSHSHVFLAPDHEVNERRTWAVIALCGAMMLAEICGGLLFGSIALVADGLHMSTHAGALLLAALAYRYARKHAEDARFTFGTGKLGDLAAFTSAIVLAMIAALIGYESISRLVRPVSIHFGEAIPIAFLGLAVNIASAWLLSRGEHPHHHGIERGHDDRPTRHRVEIVGRPFALEIFEDGVPPRFRLHAGEDDLAIADQVTIETVRPGGERQVFAMKRFDRYLESIQEVPEPHSFKAHVRATGEMGDPVSFEEHDHGTATHRDNNMRAAIIHVAADAAVSGFVIVGLLLARTFGWLWMDPVAGIVGAIVIANWSYGLVRDSGAVLLDMNPDRRLSDELKATIEEDGDRIRDLHVWRVGPGHVAAIVSVATNEQRQRDFYLAKLGRFKTLSHVTVEISPVL